MPRKWVKLLKCSATPSSPHPLSSASLFSPAWQNHLCTWVAPKFLPSQTAIVAVVLLPLLRLLLAVAAYVLLLCCSCCSCCCCSLTALKCARIKIKLPAIKAEKVNTLPRPVPAPSSCLTWPKNVESTRYSYINCTICHTSAWRHLARLKLLLTCHDSIYEVYEVAAYLQEREREREDKKLEISR